MKTEEKGYTIVGNDCGRDETGDFHCVCGECSAKEEPGEETENNYPYCPPHEPYDPLKELRKKWWFKYVDNDDPHSFITTALVSFITTVVVLILRSC